MLTVKAHWQTDTVLALARQMCERQEYSALPILADALQDADCDDDQLLGYCRTPGPRRAWVANLIAGRYPGLTERAYNMFKNLDERGPFDFNADEATIACLRILMPDFILYHVAEDCYSIARSEAEQEEHENMR